MLRKNKTVIIDIETAPLPLSSFDAAAKEYLLKSKEYWSKTNDEVESEELVQKQMALWAPTNTIVAIGVLDCGSERGAMYLQQKDERERIDHKEGDIQFWSGTEKEILERFWQVMKHVDRFVTFNGRQFDGPVLMLKSAMLGVRPTKHLSPYRYNSNIHVDLLDQMTFYSAVRKFNLDLFCKAFGITSPKAEGITGHDVAPMFTEGKLLEIGRYCLGDLRATRELFRRWEETCGSLG